MSTSCPNAAAQMFGDGRTALRAHASPAAIPAAAAIAMTPADASATGPRANSTAYPLELRAISVRFAGTAALDRVSLQLQSREFVALLGPSGAGKSTLLRVAAGLCAADQGEVYIDGMRAERMPRTARRRIAMVFQSHALIDRVSALDNVLAGRLGHVARWRGWLRRFERADRLLAMACLDRVGLLARAGQRTDTLSGGEQQRVAIARMLAQQPSLVLADEPVASLDPTTAGAVLAMLREVCSERGVSVLCSLHQPALALAHADRVIGLRQGRVELDTPVAAVDEDATAALYRA
jgi:phosphonate transport system ATP-binding protein